MSLTKSLMVLLCVSIATGILVNTSYAATPSECATFLDRGWVYDRDSVFLTRDQFQLIQTYFSHNQFHSRQQAVDASAGLTIPIADVLDLGFKGKYASSDYDQWQDALLSTTYTEISDKLEYVHAIQHVSDGLTQTLQACLAQGGLSFVLIPGAGFNTFTLEAKYVPTAGGLLKGTGKVAIQPSNAVKCSEDLSKSFTIDAGGHSLLCSRNDGTDITAVLNSAQLGTRNVKFAAHVIPPPTASLSASPTSIKVGQQTTLTWTTTDATHVSIQPGLGDVNVSGSAQVSPRENTSYTISATGVRGTAVSSAATVQVAPIVMVSRITYSFHTTDNDKDWDTQVGAEILCPGKTVASRFDFNHDKHVDHWDDWSDHGPWDLPMLQQMTADEISSCKYQLTTNGRDTWNFDARVDLHLSDGTTRANTFAGKSFKDYHSEAYQLQ